MKIFVSTSATFDNWKNVMGFQPFFEIGDTHSTHGTNAFLFLGQFLPVSNIIQIKFVPVPFVEILFEVCVKR